jgi:hypothetical protein
LWFNKLSTSKGGDEKKILLKKNKGIAIMTKNLSQKTKIPSKQKKVLSKQLEILSFCAKVAWFLKKNKTNALQKVVSR